MKNWQRIVLFLIINFAALAIGGFLQGDGPGSSYYQTLNIAPWTPPGWVFGAAWFIIMICFSLFMAALLLPGNKKETWTLFVIQLILNVIWNPIFFAFQMPDVSLVVIVSLLVIIGIFLFRYAKLLKAKSLLILPYFVWLLIATSLNLYICLMN